MISLCILSRAEQDWPGTCHIPCPLGLDGALNLARNCPCKTRRTLRKQHGRRHPIRVLACTHPYAWDDEHIPPEISRLIYDWNQPERDSHGSHVVQVNGHYCRVPFADPTVRLLIGDFPGPCPTLDLDQLTLAALDDRLEELGLPRSSDQPIFSHP